MITWVLGCLCLLLGVALFAAMQRNERLALQREEEYVSGERAAHAKCIALVAAYVGDLYAAKVLEQAADDFDSIENSIEQRLAREAYTGPGGRSVPAIWMGHRSARLKAVYEEGESA